MGCRVVPRQDANTATAHAFNDSLDVSSGVRRWQGLRYMLFLNNDRISRLLLCRNTEKKTDNSGICGDLTMGARQTAL